MKKEIIRALISALVAFLTALGATSCVFGNQLPTPLSYSYAVE